MSEEDLWDTIEADAEAFKDLTTEAGTELAALIRQLGSIQTSLIEAEERFIVLKGQRDRYLRDLIPSKMQKTGLDEVKVDAAVVLFRSNREGHPDDRRVAHGQKPVIITKPTQLATNPRN